jgi:glycosyltransferase involved in cell wall biosynthesis
LDSKKIEPNNEVKIMPWAEIENDLITKFSVEFPMRGDKLDKKDFINYYFTRDGFSRLINYYDLVIGYAVEGIYPLMTNKPYIAFEHGTIRDIPYESNTQGRFCSLVYRMASHVFVTNFDCKTSAEFLAPNRFTLINHPFDEDHGLICTGWSDLREDLLVKLDSDLLFFFPTRQDWICGDGYADKANDVFIKAVANLRRSGYRVGVICCSWGKNVEQTKELIKFEGLQEYILWLNPMGVIKFERYAKACHIVVDQFKLGSFGGVLFKAMAVGATVLSYLDEEMLLKQYAEIPPVLNCKTSDEIQHAIIKIYNDPKTLEDFRIKSLNWIKKYHSKEMTANLELKVISSLIN